MHIPKVHIVKNKMLTSCEMLTKPIIVVVIVSGFDNKKNTFIFVGQNPK